VKDVQRVIIYIDKDSDVRVVFFLAPVVVCDPPASDSHQQTDQQTEGHHHTVAGGSHARFLVVERWRVCYPDNASQYQQEHHHVYSLFHISCLALDSYSSSKLFSLLIAVVIVF